METVRATIGPALAGRYTIEDELDSGAMALVFLSYDLKHDRRVAIKVLRPELAEAIGADRFDREIEVVAGLTHPHILPLHDSGEVADALDFAHRRGVIHRDVKPGNILLAEDHALLADFGIAHLVESEDSTLTGTGIALGTPAYFSPEQATGEHDIDGRSDIYSLGCVLFEPLTGQPPFTDTSVRALIAHHITELPPHVRKTRPEVSEAVEAVAQTSLQKDPDQRFQSAEEMAGSLDLVSGGFEGMAAAALRNDQFVGQIALQGERVSHVSLVTRRSWLRQIEWREAPLFGL